MKAFIVNSAQYLGDGKDLASFASSLDGAEPKHWLNVLGYGVPDDARATYCDRYSALFYHQGMIEANGIVYFSIPVPKILCRAERGKKRLTVTVAYSPEVQRWGLEAYLGTSLKWRLFRGDVPRDGVVKAMSFEDEGEKNGAEADGDGKKKKRIKVPVPKDINGKLTGFNLRSRGTVQHDVFEWTEHPESFSESSYTLAIASHERWNRNTTAPAVPFAVVARLEDTTRTAEVYAEVRNILVEVKSRVRT